MRRRESEREFLEERFNFSIKHNLLSQHNVSHK